MPSAKKPYTKPEVKEVKLIAEEAILANCKRATGSYSKAPRCRDAALCTNKAAGS